MLSHGVTLSRSVELTAQCGKILSAGPFYPVALDDLRAVEGFGLGDFRRFIGDLHRRLGDFIHSVVVHRRDEAIRVWRNWIREDPMVRPFWWLRPDLVPQPLFFSVSLNLPQVVLGCLLILIRLMQNSERLGFFFDALGKGIPALRNSVLKLRGAPFCCLRFLCHV